MKWPEVEVDVEYDVALHGKSDHVKVLILSKSLEPPPWEKTRIRQVAGAKSVTQWRNQETGETTQYAWGRRGDENWVEVEVWFPIWLPINKITRTWEEHEIEMEIENEINRERDNERERQRKIREAEAEERRLKEEEFRKTINERIERVNSTLAALFTDRSEAEVPSVRFQFGHIYSEGLDDIGVIERILDLDKCPECGRVTDDGKMCDDCVENLNPSRD